MGVLQSFVSRFQEDLENRYKSKRPPNPADGPQPPGQFSFGTQLQGGPRYTDAFQSKPAPSLTRLVENYHAVTYAMVNFNRDKVSRLPLRLMADGSRVQGKPSRACDPIKLSRFIGQRLARNGQISPAAVDQVYEIRNHMLLDVLDNPDPWGNFSRKKLIGLTCAFMDVVGSFYLVPEGNGWDWTDDNARVKGPPEYLWVVYPQYVIPIRLGASPIVDRFQYFAARLPRNSTLWFRHNHSLRDPYGAAFSATYAAEPYRKQEQELVSILSQAMDLGPRPSLIATAKDAMMPPGENEREAFQVDLKRKFAGAYAGSVLVNAGAWDFETPDYPKADTGAIDAGQHARDNMAAILGLPATYFGTESNLANLQAADAQHAVTAIQPRCDTIAEVFTQLAKRFDPRLFFQFDPALEENEESRMKVVEMRLKNGLTTPNQENEESQWPPFPEGDEHWIEGTRKTMTMILEQHTQALEQGKAEMDSMGTQDEIAQGSHELAKDGQEHSQKMDKAQLKLESQKSEEERVLDEAKTVLRSIQERLARAG